MNSGASLLFLISSLLTLPTPPCLCRNLLPSSKSQHPHHYHRPPDVLLTIKTTRSNHNTRLREALASWALARNRPKGLRILFVTDSSLGNVELAKLMGNDGKSLHSQNNVALLNSGCPVGHQNEALCCKMAFELQLAFVQQPDFWCHFDDDSFVLLSNLVALLHQFPSTSLDLYLGHVSTDGPISLSNDIPSHHHHHHLSWPNNTISNKRKFWFGTGGAGICLSLLTLRKLHSLLETNHQRLEMFCAQLGVPDDVAIGFLLNNFLGIELTNSAHFHSHLEQIDLIPRENLANEISLSATFHHPTTYNKMDNYANVPEYLPPSEDPMQFRSLQKFLDDEFERKRRRV